MKKFLSTVLAIAMVMSLTACSGGESSVSGTEPTSAQGEMTETTPSTDTPDVPEDAAPKSNPVAMNEEGDIDMEIALAYETDFEALKASFEAKTIDPDKPVSENSNEDTLEVFNYLRSIYGKQMIASQQMMNIDAHEDLVYYNATGDLPAMKGFDFIFCTGGYKSDEMIDMAIKWHKESGGLVTFTWHWNVPRNIDDYSQGYAFYKEEIINFSHINAVTPGTKEYEQVIHDIDLIASKLQRLESEGVTVLFRPLHEASGTWFWWGVQDKEYVLNETFQKLWYMIFDRLENYHKLTNIIWVWNGQSQHCLVSPNSYDIAGVDYYVDSTDDHSAQNGQYKRLSGLNQKSGKMLALSECGNIPDPADCVATDTYWLYYMIWNGGFVYETSGDSGNAITDFNGTPSPNTERMTNEMLQEYFSHEIMITHKDLPEFRTGTKDIPQAIRNWEYFKID